MRVLRTTLLLILLVSCKSQSKPQHHEDRADPATAPANLSLDVTIDGTPAKWDATSFAKAPHFVGTNNGGQSRDVWSLRELVTTLVGPTARVASVSNASTTKTIDAAAWADPAKVPIVHTTRRGALKFRWADAAGTWQEAELNDVTRLEIVH